MPGATATNGKKQRPSRVVPALPHALSAKAQAARRQPPAAAVAVGESVKDESSQQQQQQEHVAVAASDELKPTSPVQPDISASASTNSATDTSTVDTAQEIHDSSATAKPSPTPIPQRPAARELPPPFYPSASTPAPGAPQQRKQQRPLDTSASPVNLVFGGMNDDSGSSSPARAFPPPPFVPGAGAAPHHGYHYSEPFAHQSFQHFQQGPGPAIVRPPFSRHIHHHHNPVFRPHQAGPFQPHRQSPHPASGRPHEDMPVMPNDQPFSPHHQQHSSNFSHPYSTYQLPQTFPLDAVHADPAIAIMDFKEGDKASADPEEWSCLAIHIRTQFADKEYADLHLLISHDAFMFPPIQLPGHGLILARSPKVRSLMAMHHPNQGTFQKHLGVVVSDRFINHPVAITKTLARLYGDPLLDINFLYRLFGPAFQPGSSEHIKFSLAYAAAGHFFQMEDVVSRGLDLVSSFITLDTVGKALAFALEGGLNPSWTQPENSNSELIGGSASSADEAPSRMDSPAAAPAYGMYSDRLVSSMMDFIVRSIPSSFIFISSAPQLFDLPRLPFVAEPRHTRSESRLSQIRFGDMTLDEQQNAADPSNAAISSVLLSIPFSLLKHILEHPAIAARFDLQVLPDLIRSVVAEREARRVRAVEKGTPQPEDRLWLNTAWSERVDSAPSRPSGVQLTRQHVGAHTPPSSASGKS